MEPSKTTMAQYLERWLDHIKSQVSPRSHERYVEIARKNLAPLIGSIVLTKLQPAQISAAYVKASQWPQGWGGRLSPRTVHHMHRYLKQALGQAVKWQLLTRNPADAVDPPKVERKAMQTYDMAQTAALIEWHAREPGCSFRLCWPCCVGFAGARLQPSGGATSILAPAQLAVVESAEQTRRRTLQGTQVGQGAQRRLVSTVVEELKAWRARQAQDMLRLGVRPDGDTFVSPRMTEAAAADTHDPSNGLG